MPIKPESSYFVSLDAPPPASRYTDIGRDSHWNDPPGGSGSPVRRRRRKFRIRPVGVLLVALLAWVGWAYTTPGGPSARINSWIDRTRGEVNNASVGPGLSQTSTYFNHLFLSEGSYPDMSQTQIQEDPNAGMGLSMNFVWCSPRAVILQDLSAGGSVSRLLLDGKDLGQVDGSHACPTNLAKPVPWKVGSAN